MPDRLNITRRDFLNGCALSLAAGTSLSPLEILAREAATVPYPPLLTGLRGSQAGSYEVAHAVARAGARYPRPATASDSTYDLIVVGGGLVDGKTLIGYGGSQSIDCRLIPVTFRAVGGYNGYRHT